MQQGMTFAEFESKFRKRCNSDPAFRADFIADPKAAIEKYAGHALPDEYTVQVHVMTPTSLHLVVPPASGELGEELTDEQLEQVAGGEIVGGVIVGLFFAVLGSGIGAGTQLASDW